MPTFEITAPNGKKYRVTGPNAEGAKNALKKQLAALESSTPKTDEAKRLDGKVNPETGNAIPDFVPMGKDGKPIASYNPKTGEVEKTSVPDKVTAFGSGFLEGIPIVGPALDEFTDMAAAGLGTLTGEAPYEDAKRRVESYDDQIKRDNPNVTFAGNVTGTVAPMLALGLTRLGGQALGVTSASYIARQAAAKAAGLVAPRIALREVGGMAVRSGLSNAAIGAADTAARGGDLRQTLTSGGIGGVIGAVVPGLGAGASLLGRAAKDFLAPRINSLTRPLYEAGRRVTQAIDDDAANGGVLGATDEASAVQNGQDLLNVDRGGEKTRALARSAANNDAEARGLIDRTVKDRFASQGERAQSFIDRISRGAADSQAAQDAISAAAKKSNPVAYGKAYKSAAAQDMSQPELLNLLRSPAIRDAAKQAETRSANRAVTEGFNPVKSPFVIDDAGTVSMKPGVKPTLQFWDQVKRNLDADIGKASRAGDKTAVADLTALKQKLVSELDAAVPEYKAARQGAMGFFEAEDALDAGKKFVTQNRNLPETQRALAGMTPTERTAFAVGFASELKEAIKQTGDSVNVIKKIFGRQQSREKIMLALGRKNFLEFEQFVKVENAMDTLRGAMGNSKTAQYLAEMGLAGTGTGLLTGDWKQGLGAAIITGVVRKGGRMVDERMTKQIAQLLLSNDPAALQRAATMAARNPQAAAAVEAIQDAIGAAIKGVGMEQSRPSLEAPATVH